MARLWTCGFELQTLAANVEVTSATGTTAISTTVHRAGTAALRCNPTAGTGYIEQHLDTASAVKRTFHRFYLRLAALPSATTTIYAIGQASLFPLHLRLQADGSLRLRDANTSTDVGSASAPLAPNTWYRVEIDAADSGSTATTRPVVAYLDGTAFSGTAMISGTPGFSRIRAGIQTTATGDLYIDDIAVNDTAGTAQTGLPGPGNVVHLRPDGTGDSNDWDSGPGGTTPAPANNYTRLRETTPDDGTSYNQTSLSGTHLIDDVTLQSTASAGIGASDDITLVSVGGRIGSTGTVAASLVYRIKSEPGGTVAESPSVSVALNGWATHKAAAPFVYQLTSYTDPQTGAAWTPTRLDTAQIGYRANVSQITSRRVSTLWALVEFVPDTSGPGTPAAELTDDFDTPTVDTGRWPNNYNTAGALPSQPAGRARVPCGTGMAAYASAAAYTLADSHVHVQAFPPARGGATGDVYCQLLVLSSTAGTQIAFEINVATNLLLMAVHVGYADEGGAAIPYDPVEHAWLRIREAGGTLYWETSSDGREWVVRHTAASPAWVSDGDLRLQLLAHRDNGTADFAEFDHFNTAEILSDGYQIAVDWAADGDFSDPHDNVTDDVLSRGPLTFAYGRDQTRAFSPPQVGTIGFSLCNTDRLYSPENPASPLADDFSPAAPIRAEVVVDGTLYPLVRGRVDDFTVHADRGDTSVDIVGQDNLALLDTEISTELYAARRTGELMHIILDAVGWTGPRDIDLGATHIPYWWADATDAFSAMAELLQAEGPPSIAYAAGDGTFVFRDRHHRLTRDESLDPQAIFYANARDLCNAPAVTGTHQYLEPFDYVHGLKDIANVISFDVEERRLAAGLEVVWESDATITLGLGESTQISVRTNDPFTEAADLRPGIDVISSGTGALQMALSRRSGQSLVITLRAVGGAVTVTRLQLRARPLETVRVQRVAADDAVSIARHGRRSYPGDVGGAGFHDAYAITQLLLAHYAQRRPTVQLRIVSSDASHYEQVLRRTISDRVTVRNGELGLDADFFIERMEHQVRRQTVDGCRRAVHYATFGLERASPGASNNPFTFDQTGSGFDQGVFDPTAADNPATIFIFDHPIQGRFDVGRFAT